MQFLYNFISFDIDLTMPQTSDRSSSRSRSRSGKGIKVSHKAKKRAVRARKKEKPLNERSLAELQMVARSHGIPFGGLTRTQLIEKIIAYR